MTPLDAAVLGAAYLLGAVSFGPPHRPWPRGVDPRTAGSGNIGATNVGRTAGRGWGVLTLALDVAKGAAAPWAVARFELGGPALAAGAGLAAVVGHVYPVYLGFRGGKGVATAAGVFAALAPVPLGIALLAFAAVVAATRVVALGSLAAATALPVAVFGLDADPAVKGLAVAAALLIFVRHRSNLRGWLRRPPSEPRGPGSA